MPTNASPRTSRPPSLKYESLGALLDRNIPPREFLIEPWLRQGESALIYAAPGVGKSMLTQTLALAVAGGGSVLGWNSPRPRRVLCLDGEMASADVQERARALLPTVAGIDVAKARDNLVMLARQSQDPDGEFPDPGFPEGQHLLLKRCVSSRVELLIADNLSTLFTVDDENSASAVRPAVQFLMRMKQAGIAVILVHHTGKNTDNYRGSSMLATTFEVIMALKKGTDTQDTDGPSFELSFDKYRAKHRDEVTVPRAVRLRDVHGVTQWETEKSARAAVLAFVRAVQSGKFDSQMAMAAHFKVNPSTITRWKTDAIHVHRLLTEDAFTAHMAAGAEQSNPDF